MSISIETVAKTCNCGMVYTVPNWMSHRVECPACAWRDQDKLRQRRDELIRSNRSLRGVIKRLQGRRAEVKERK